MGSRDANSLSRMNQTTIKLIDFNDVVSHIISCYVIDWMIFSNRPNSIARVDSNNFSRTITEGRISFENASMSNNEP